MSHIDLTSNKTHVFFENIIEEHIKLKNLQPNRLKVQLVNYIDLTSNQILDLFENLKKF